jgi:polysaccharide export outer membrane protein
MRHSMLAFGLIAALSLGGCSANGRYQARSFEDINAPYTLASGDRLRVIVFGQDSLTNSYSVDGSGRISLPLVGAVSAQGHTTESLARAIEARLRDGYLREPKVAVEVEAYRPFFALGEISTAGQYPYINGMTVQNAVAVAGGYTPRAYKGAVDLTRVVDGVPVTYSVPPTHQLRPGDTITVRERFF